MRWEAEDDIQRERQGWVLGDCETSVSAFSQVCLISQDPFLAFIVWYLLLLCYLRNVFFFWVIFTGHI